MNLYDINLRLWVTVWLQATIMGKTEKHPENSHSDWNMVKCRKFP